MKIGFNCSSCDLFHAGHVTMLKMENNYVTINSASSSRSNYRQTELKTNQFNQYMKGMSNFKDVNMLMRFLCMKLRQIF